MNKSLGKFIKNNGLQMAGILVVIINIWLAYRLAPLEQSIALVTQRVFALEDKTSDQADKDDIKSIRADIRELRDIVISDNKSK